ncbi:hypothetical protein [Alkalihalobacillus sp. LMS39]|uniref:hypothetical protein n=1 Tax=Alkalihalobacillus sp. LMS39 TaxID=2924032 RepID=UPI001FB38FA4|nr:hypothetical protein [Alkalihalobacillus sp. LMS39]UOE92363.1 hypothetical protein MM271_14020 [Alkalihalobacillus sp. LMS39]
MSNKKRLEKLNNEAYEIMELMTNPRKQVDMDSDKARLTIDNLSRAVMALIGEINEQSIKPERIDYIEEKVGEALYLTTGKEKVF